MFGHISGLNTSIIDASIIADFKAEWEQLKIS